MMKTKIKYYLILLSFSPLLLFTSCIEEFEADIPAEDTDLLVVEGTIYSGKMSTFILSRSLSVKSSDIPRMEWGAMVSVRGTDGSEYKARATDGYYYACWIDHLDPDVAYYLHIETDGEVYESEPQTPLRTEKIADVRGVQNTPDSDIDVLVTPDVPLASDNANYYAWTYDETWEVYPDYTTDIYFDIELEEPVFKDNQFPVRGWKDATSRTIMIGGSANYEGQHIRRLKIYDIVNSDERIFHRYSGLLHQRAISKAEYEYELARRQAGSEMGGLFTPQPSSLPTNLHCLTSDKRVIGFVGCSMNTTDYRFFLNAEDFTIHRPPHADARIWLDDCDKKDCCKMVQQGLFLCEWIDERLVGHTLRTAWAHIHQLDVRYRGAYIEEPEFWSLTENVSY